MASLIRESVEGHGRLSRPWQTTSAVLSARADVNAVACPWCGGGIAVVDDSESRVCPACKRTFELKGQVLSWHAPDGKSEARQRDLWTLLLRQLNPLGSRLSPLRYFTDWRVEQYYQRTTTDRQLSLAWARHNLDTLHLPPGAAVLDHGCGRGRHAALLAQLGYAVAAQDIAAHAWWQTLRNCFFQKVPAAAPRLPWTDRSFALVVDAGVIHYMTPEQVTALASEVFRVLEPGGYWLLVEANDESYGAATMRRIVGHLHPVQPVRETVARAGFQEIDLSYEGFYAPLWPSMVDFARKILRPTPLDLNDFQSALAARIPARRRKFWRLRLTKPHGNA